MRSNRRKNRRVSVTIEGVVALAEWADSGDDADLVILTDDEEEYYIDATDSVVRPARFINARVEATGKLFERDGLTQLAIRRIRVLDPYDSEADQEGFTGEHFGEASEDFDYWSDEGIVDRYARYARGSGGMAD